MTHSLLKICAMPHLDSPFVLLSLRKWLCPLQLPELGRLCLVEMLSGGCAFTPPARFLLIWVLRFITCQPMPVCCFITPDYGIIRGPFTASDNAEHGQFWSPILLGDEVVVHLLLPVGQVDDLKLALSSVNHAYAEFGRYNPLSGSCNLDVVCSAADGFPQVDPWRDQIRSVGVYTISGTWTCTGAMVNNTAEDLTPYFLTADHCGVSSANAPSMIVYWNFENSTCRPPGSPASGGPGHGSLAQFNSGAIFRAEYGPSDMTLVELEEAPDPAFNLYWSGWDATAGDTTSAVAIHHPNTDEKRISFENDPTNTTSYLGSSSPGDGTHMRVVDWDLGTTEPGSSGSPLFSPEQRIVGQLHGGYAACGNDLSDWYGRVSISWNGGGTSSTSLAPWLDPLNSGTLVFDGRGLDVTPDFELMVEPTAAAICTGNDAVYTISVLQLNGYTDSVTLAASGNPYPTTTTFSPNPGSTPFTSTLTIGNTGGVPAGLYNVEITGIAPTSTHTTTVGLHVATAVPNQTTLQTPANGAQNQPPQPTFTWNPVTTASSYDIEIATDPGFNNIVASAQGLTDPTYTPETDLATSTTFYWRIWTRNGCGLGASSTAYTFTTQAAPGDCGPGTSPNEVYYQGFESGAGGWTSSGTNNTWALAETNPYGGSWHYHANDVNSVSDQRLASPAVALPIDEFPLTMKFWHVPNMEPSSGGCFDGGILEISSNGGATWTQVPDADLLVGGYTGTVSTSYGNPLGGLQAWCGGGSYMNTIANLDAYAGQSVQFRMRLGTDSSVSAPGWDVDDVTVQSCVDSGEYAMTIGPSTNHIGIPGETVTHEFVLHNTGTQDDSYQLGLSGHTWDTTLVTPSPLAVSAGMTTTILVEVTLPYSAIMPDSFTVTAVSMNLPSLQTSSSGVSDLVAVYFDGPQNQIAFPGQTVTYTFNLQNGGSVDDIYDLSISGANWTSNILTTSPITLTAGMTTSIMVAVMVPEYASSSDSFTVTATSQLMPVLTATVNGTTQLRQLFLPLIMAP